MICKYPYFGFQFLYGAIKRNENAADEMYIGIFQFLYGAIKRGRPYNNNKVSVISIPLWCD